MNRLNLKRVLILGVLMGSSFSVLGEDTMTTSTMGNGNDQAQNVVGAPEGMTTQMTQDDQKVMEAVNKILPQGVQADISAGTVTLKGTLAEDQLKNVVSEVSKLPGVSAVNIKEMNTPGEANKVQAGPQGAAVQGAAGQEGTPPDLAAPAPMPSAEGDMQTAKP